MSAGYKPPALPYLERPVTVDELACVYSALILADDDIPVTPDKINTIVKAANIEVESIWPSLFARALAGANLKEMIQNSVLTGGGGGPGVAAAAGGGPAAAAAPAEEESKPPAEPEEDSDDDDFGLGLFD